MEHAAKVLLPLHLSGWDISITEPVLWTLVASFILIVFSLFAVRRLELVPMRPSQNLLEFLFEFIENQIIKPTDLNGAEWTPLIASVFLFILFNDWMGIIPGAVPATGNINETASLALLIFAIGLFIRFKKKGLWEFFKSIVPEGVNGPIVFLMFPIELVSQLFKPFSLAIRLFANMSGGHLLLLTIMGFTTMFGNLAVSIVSVGGAVMIMLFEIFVGFIQAYVFAFLSALLIGESMAEEH